MAKVAKKKKKKKLGGRSSGSSTSGKKVTPLRPYRNPRTAPCIPGCPIGNDARGGMAAVGTTEPCGRTPAQSFELGFRAFAKTNPFPAITGRLCTRCCEMECNRQKKDGSVNINKVERFLGDFAVEQGLKFDKPGEQQDGKVAVVGAGPSGLTCAYHLALRGWSVTVIDAKDRPGGFLRYVPTFRLPKKVLEGEIQRILELGVELKPNTQVGKDITVEQLKKDYKAVYVAVGSHTDRHAVRGPFVADNAMTFVELFSRINSGEKVDLGDNVVVLGGGDSALDAARAAKRLGANATIVYRRTKEDMPAIPFDVEQTEAEGIKFEFLAGPKEMVKEGGKGSKLLCDRLKPGYKEGSGRHRPIPTGETVEIPFTTLIQGQIQEPDYADPLVRVGLDPRKAKADGKIKVDDGLFSSGDANKLGHVTVAIANGRRAAERIDAELKGEEYKGDEWGELIFSDKVKMEWYEAKDRHVQQALPVEQRMGADVEVNTGLTEEDCLAEGKRCFSCGMCMDCDNCWMYCQDQAVDKAGKDLPMGQHYNYKHELCTGCEKCAEECPCNYLEMR